VRPGLAFGATLLAGCATTRVVPVPAPGVALDPDGGAAAAADGVEIVVRPSAWVGSPSYLPDYVTPFHLPVVNGTGKPIQFAYGDLQLFDEERFQHTAMPPEDVGRLLRWGGRDPDARLAEASASVAWRQPALWYPWWWGPPLLLGLRAAPPRRGSRPGAAGRHTPEPQARIRGYVYFPRLRREASRLVFEFHYRPGDVPRIITLPFAVQQGREASRLTVAR
jgi:hypothetical protein